MQTNLKDSENGLVTNAAMYGFDEAIIASGYPMKAKVSDILTVYPTDVTRAARLSNVPTGTGHDNFLSGIVVQFNLNASIKMWTEFERYHFAQIVSSQSTIHCLSKMSLYDPSRFNEYTDSNVIFRLYTLQEEYNKTHKKEDLLKLLYSCPVGLKLTAMVTTNMLQLKTMYQQRKNHTLPEWNEFCKWYEDAVLDKVKFMKKKDDKDE